MSATRNTTSAPLKVAGIGAGYFSQFHYEAWRRMPDVTLSAICDRDREAADKLADRYDIPRVYNDIDQMLAQESLDLVDVILPPEAHAKVLDKVIRQPLHAICQKPFTRNLDEAKQITQQAQAAGCELVIHENFRFMPWHRKLRDIIQGGELGDILNARFCFRTGDGQGPQAYLDRQPYFQTMPRLLVHETAIHFVDTFRYLFGEPDALYARLKRCNPVIKGEDSGIIMFDYADGLSVTFDGNRLLDHATSNPRRTFGEFGIEGTRASLHLDGEARLSIRAFGSVAWSEIDYQWQDRGFAGDCVYRLSRHVVDHLLHGAPLENRASDYLANLRLEEAIYESDQTGHRISLEEFR